MGSGRRPFTATTFTSLDFLTMKLLVLILLAGLVSSMPRKGSRPNSQKEDKEDPSTIIRCMAENWQQGEEQIQACPRQRLVWLSSCRWKMMPVLLNYPLSKALRMKRRAWLFSSALMKHWKRRTMTAA